MFLRFQWESRPIIKRDTSHIEKYISEFHAHFKNLKKYPALKQAVA